VCKLESAFNKNTYSFPSGFVPLVVKAAKDPESTKQALGFQVQLVDARVAPTVPDANADLAWLRDYQLEAVQKVVERTRGILWLPTAAGKTEIAVGLTRALPCRWGFLVHRLDLMQQAADRYELRTGLPAGRIGEGHWDVPADAQFISGSFQSFHAALKAGDARAKALIESFEGLMIDECHTVAAPSFTHVVSNARNAYYRVGLSGTPIERDDRSRLVGALGPVVYRIKSQVLIDRGVLAKPTVRLATCVQLSSKPTWQGVYGECVVRSGPRNRVLIELAKRAAKPAFLFVKEVDHGKKLVDLLMRSGINAEFVWGAHSVEWRQSHVKRLVAGHFDVLVCSVIFQEGIDVPSLRSVIVAAGGKSTIATLQRLGRGMRVEKDAAGNVVAGGAEFEVWDVLDKGNKWLEKHARARLNAFQGEGYETFVEPPSIATAVQKKLPFTQG
jgi:superfamily II DNA or RNA helicase